MGSSSTHLNRRIVSLVRFDKVRAMWLVLGGSGFLGPELKTIPGIPQLLFTHYSHAMQGGIPFDVRSSSVRDLVRSAGDLPQAALILLGVTNVDACARDPRGTREINVEGIIRVIDELKSLGVIPVFTSSDAVFDGSRALWTEEEEVQPILTYGRQKMEVENYLSSQPPPWLIMRLPKLLSEKKNVRCMLTNWVEALGRGERILCATDQFFTPADAGDVAKAMVDLVQSGASGLYHLGGGERLSRRELLGAVMNEYRAFAEPKATIVECSLRDVPVREPRPLDTSMDSSRYAALGLAPIRPASEIARLAVRDHFRSAAAGA